MTISIEQPPGQTSVAEHQLTRTAMAGYLYFTQEEKPDAKPLNPNIGP